MASTSEVESMDGIQILQTKMQPPPAQSNFIKRSRLYDLLDTGLKRKLTLISAPAGFGKSSLVRHWLNKQTVQIAWFSADEDDQNPSQFLLYLIKAMQSIQAEFGNDLIYFFQAPNEVISVKALVHSFINSLTTIQDDFCIIIDDFHLVDTPEIQEIVSELIEYMPAQAHLIIISRSDPGLKLARLRSLHQVVEIRASELMFTVKETAEYLGTVLSNSLPENDIIALNTHIEGWAAGLQLAAISLQNIDNPSDFIQNFKANERYIADYLMEEVLQQQPAQIRDFLLQTSILERLHPELCQSVTQIEDSDEIIQYLHSSNLFIFPVDESRSWFRYHKLFAELLRQRLRSLKSGHVATLHSRAADWFEANDYLIDASQHAIRAKDFDHAARILNDLIVTLVKRSQFAIIARLTGQLPEDILEKYPRLSIYRALALFYSAYQMEEVMHYYRLAENAENGADAAGEIYMFRALLAALQGSAAESADFAEKAIETLPHDNIFLKSFAAGIRGVAYMFIGDLDSAHTALHNSIEIAEKAGNLLNKVVGLCHLAEISVLRGDLQEAVHIYQKALDESKDTSGQILPVGGIALMGISHIYLERHELEKAESTSIEGIELTNKWAVVGTIRGYAVLIKLLQIQNRTDEAIQKLEEARQIAVEFDATDFDDYVVDLIEANLWLHQKDYHEVDKFLTEYELPDDFSTTLEDIPGNEYWKFYLYEFKQILTARYYLETGQPEKVEEILNRQVRNAVDDNRIWPAIIMFILLARSQNTLGNTDTALSHIQKALSLAETGGFILSFVQEGKYILPLLQYIREEADRYTAIGCSKSFLIKLMTLIEVNYPVPSSQSTKDGMLSDRELEVLNCLAQGMTNSEIADSLYISLNTVRTHTKNIYDKLNVHSRTRAAARGKELGLI